MTCNKVIQILIFLSGASALCSLYFGHALQTPFLYPHGLTAWLPFTAFTAGTTSRSNKCYSQSWPFKPCMIIYDVFPLFGKSNAQNPVKDSRPQGIRSHQTGTSVPEWLYEGEPPANPRSRKKIALCSMTEM